MKHCFITILSRDQSLNLYKNVSCLYSTNTQDGTCSRTIELHRFGYAMGETTSFETQHSTNI